MSDTTNSLANTQPNAPMEIEVEARLIGAKSGLRQLRHNNMVPAIVYGDTKDATPISVPRSALLKLYHSGRMLSTALELKLNGNSQRVIARDVQLDAVQDIPVHADFMRLGKGTKITLDIPVRFINTEKSPGIRRGGVLNVVRHAVELRCLAEALPDYITIDLTGSDIGASFHISGVDLPEGVLPTIERDFTIATIAAPTKVEERVVTTPEDEDAPVEGDEAADGAEAKADADADSKSDQSKSGDADKAQDNRQGNKED